MGAFRVSLAGSFHGDGFGRSSRDGLANSTPRGETRFSRTRRACSAFSPDSAALHRGKGPVHGSFRGQGIGKGRADLALDEEAIRAGRAPQCLVVFVNGLEMGMYVDWADGSAPVESMIVRDLVPHIDATYRTRAVREGRLLDGFSMGGYGAARLGLKFPELFRAVSMVAAGPLQADLSQTPRASRIQAADLLRRAFGGDQAVFREVSPRRLAERNAKSLGKGSLLRMVIGERDETLPRNLEFHRHLQALGIPHQWTILPGVGHDPEGVFRALGDANWGFYRAAFAESTAPLTHTPGDKPASH